MSSFASTLRAGDVTISLPDAGANAITVRVEMPEVWNAVRLRASSTSTVAETKAAALDALYPRPARPSEFVMKFRGYEILDEQCSLADAGAGDDSILLMTFRRRRPVR